MGLVRAAHLNQWAMTHDARIKIGELLRRLTHTSIPLSYINGIRFLANESTQLKGWDGLLDCDSDVTWVPKGTSVWELGTGAEPRDKIRTDFKNRLKKDLPLGWSQEETTYVAVTIRSLDDLIELENELKQNSPWRDVKVYDAITLEEWIAQYPSVTAWLQEQGVGPPPSIHTLQNYWHIWSDVTHPIISTELVLADREKDASGLRSALKNPGGVINIQADSPDEAVAFVFSAVDTDETEFREHFLAKSIVLRSKDDADRMRDFNQHYIVLIPPATEKAQVLTRYNHTVINALGNSSLTQRIDFNLKRSLRSSFTEALSKMGMTNGKAEIEARACGASPSVWRVWNLLNQGDLSEIPIWGRPDHANIVIPAVLMGGWSDKFEGDKEVTKAIGGYDFETYTELLHPFLSTDNPFIVRIADAWILTAPTVAFALLIHQITSSHLERLSKITYDVFTEIDPTIDLAPDDRPFAAMKTEGMRHSIWLRDGLAETLLRVVVIGKGLERTGAIAGSQSCQSYVDHLIRNLPGLREDWRLLASLRSQLPVLAEAAPFPFLEALECLLQGTPEKILPIFAEGEGTFGGHAFHPHFLWALETLAWEPSLLGNVGLVLANLAKIDPGGRLANKPINSLREIFLAWHPGTNANLELRLQVLDIIIKRYPDIGWTLLMALMPKSHDSSSPTHEPKWKDFGRSQREPLTRGDVWAAYQQYIDRALLHAGSEPSRWEELIGIYSQVPEFYQEAIENGLRELAKTRLTQAARKSIWETIRDFINRHRGYPDASWALPGDRLDRLEEISGLFSPTDQIDQIAWLFNKHYPDVPFPRKPLEEMRNKIKRLRNEAIDKLWREGSINSLITLLDNVAFPVLVSTPLIDSMQDVAQVLYVFEKTNQGSVNQQLFAKCLSGQAYKKFGDQWTNNVLLLASKLEWPPDAMFNVVEQYPDSLKTFELVSSLGPEIEKLYWKTRPGWIHAEDTPSFMVAVNNLIEARRAFEVMEQIQENLSELGSKEVMKIIDQSLEELKEGKLSRISSDVGYWIGELFDWLRMQSDIDKVDIDRREYAYLPLLIGHHEEKHLSLHELLANDPNFFVDVLCDLYKPSSGEAEDEPISEERRRRAQFAWDLLRSWHRPPGVEEKNKVNVEKLKEWVETARRLATEKDRIDIADEHIGKVLYHYPPDPIDSAWPHSELRELLEDLHCKGIETGIEIEQFNTRGVVSKSLFEGGSQERELAKKWHSWAETLGLRWPRTRAMLERISESWEAQAMQEDERAEKDRHRFRK